MAHPQTVQRGYDLIVFVVFFSFDLLEKESVSVLSRNRSSFRHTVARVSKSTQSGFDKEMHFIPQRRRSVIMSERQVLEAH